MAGPKQYTLGGNKAPAPVKDIKLAKVSSAMTYVTDKLTTISELPNEKTEIELEWKEELDSPRSNEK